jgi:taurine dioxygenase
MNTVAVPEQWTVRRLAPALGAEITGLRLADLDTAGLDVLRRLLVEHSVIFLPGQSPDVDAHVGLGEALAAQLGGELEGHPNLKYDTPHPKIFELRASGGGVADEWHTDITFSDRPALASVLHMVKCPEVGGDTMWTNLCAAHDELSEPMQDFLAGLTALHDALPHNRPDRMAVHPVVRVHPETGRRALYVNEHFTRRIVELGAEESDALLAHLVHWVQKPRFTVRYRWSEGTVAIWDNRATQHFVLNDFDGERVIQRVTVMGDAPEGACEPRWRPYVRDGRLSATSRHDRQLFMYLKGREGAADD